MDLANVLDVLKGGSRNKLHKKMQSEKAFKNYDFSALYETMVNMGVVSPTG